LRTSKPSTANQHSQKSRHRIANLSLCNLGVLCVSVEALDISEIHHRDAENTKAAQRIKA